MNMEYKNLIFDNYSELFLEKSWDWLNDDEIKKLTLTPDFTKKEQKVFFDSLPHRKDYYIKGITYNEKPIGACGLKKITSTSAEYWGYIGEKEYWGKKLGGEIIDFLMDVAKKMGLENIYLHVSEQNERAIRLYKKKGFAIDAIENQILKMKYYL